MKEKLHELLRTACSLQASDLHLTEGLSPVLRVFGELHPLPEPALGREEIRAMAEAILSEREQHILRERGEVDFSFELPGTSRFRFNLYRQRGSLSLAVRVIPVSVPAFDQLLLPPVLKAFAAKPHGLVLVTGPTGSGKSTTLAAMVQHINETMRKHIITLEDPIEYVYEHRRSLIQQREVGKDTGSFASGLRAALRQDPDVILVGEMRDLETISTALTAAETGHLVLATLHTSSAAATVERIVDVFPGDQQNKVRVQLANILTAAVAQRLFPRADGRGRIAATEILYNNTAASSLIRSGKLEQLPSVMMAGRDQGMHTMQMSLRELTAKGIVSASAAAQYV
ncbi:type IV pilus twitching motility protein PilT [Ectobacillus ponti]|uniref:Type IV pilus twitching motility protein PilT n=1 Tax=Ectobacillus ponti TaxID=2961894 RepID=A0AA41X8Z6_9BACI|nr:type IV pilus twitching motility protein PilT [Ectobacillus ponti]MCP8968498.1 type IV pilus twitching motility protein PilT [Ectobacillus ponti]